MTVAVAEEQGLHERDRFRSIFHFHVRFPGRPESSRQMVTHASGSNRLTPVLRFTHLTGALPTHPARSGAKDGLESGDLCLQQGQFLRLEPRQ